MTDTQAFTLRGARPGDLAAMVGVQNAAMPDWQTTEDDLRRRMDQRDPAHFHTDLVAELGGRVVGFGTVGHDSFSYEEWRYSGRLVVHPEARRRGVGSALYAELLRRVQERGAREVRAMSDSKPHSGAGRAFLEARGFQVVWERYESEIDVDAADLDALAPVLRGVEEGGVRLVSLADLAGDPQRDRWLYELDWELFQDVPLGMTLTKKTQEQWVREELDDPQLRPHLSFVAVQDGVNDPLTGDYVGYSTLGRSPAGFHYIGMTGVRRGWRGRSVAKALKLRAMLALRGAGGGIINTFNDPPNKAMLGMNEQLGFRRVATIYRYELRLDGVQPDGIQAGGAQPDGGV